MSLKFKNVFCFVIFIFFLNCNSNEEKLKIENQIKEAVIGDWDFVEEISKYDLLGGPELPPPNPRPDEFNSISITKDSVEFYLGIYDFSTFLEKEKSRKSFYGIFTSYKMDYDTLVIHNLVPPNHPYKWKFERCENDTLEFRLRDSTLVRYKRIQPITDSLPSFDAIIVSTTGCYGTCEVLNLLINTNGELLFQGQHYINPIGLHSGKLNKYVTQKLFKKFEKSNPLKLNDFNYDFISDQESYFISLVQDGKIVKTIEDYAYQSPKELIWAYLPFSNMYQTITLTELKENINEIPRLTYFEFKTGNKLLKIYKSESFYLFSELEKAKLSNVNFKAKFELLFHQPENDLNQILKIETDGRYYRYNFENGKVIILDLGYNFIERNFKNRNYIEDIFASVR